MRRLILAFAMCLLSVTQAQAFLNDYPINPANCTTTTANATSATVGAAVVAASTGDTICVLGNISDAWGFGFTIPNNKGITLAGCAAISGCVGTTTITSTFPGMNNTTAPWRGSRITGFTFSGTNSGFIVAAIGYRVDHNTATQTSIGTACWWPIGHYAATSLQDSEGLFDHNTLHDCRLEHYGEWTGGGASNGHSRWSEALNMGTSKANYWEDNTIDFSTWCNACNFDSNLGARYVARFNTMNNVYIGNHASQADGLRGSRLTEFYYNDFSNNSAIQRSVLFRGGTGMAFHNVFHGNWPGSPPHFDFDTVRSCFGTSVNFPIWGAADGLSYADGNEVGKQGYLVRDQPGASTDSFFWTSQGLNSGAPIPTQLKAPFGMWKNTAPDDGGEMVLAFNTCTGYETRLATQIVENRDIYQYSSIVNAATPQTIGVREGTLAQRPASCTTGVMYWATDQGSWNTSVSNAYGVNAAGADGLLYQCSATDTWSLYYTPYTYPHPLQGAASPPAPDAIATSYVAAFRGPTFAAIIWSRSTDASHKAYNVYRCTYSGACSNLVKTITPASAAAAHSPETQWIDSSLYVAGTYYYSISDVNTSDYVGPPTTPSGLTVTGKQ